MVSCSLEGFACIHKMGRSQDAKPRPSDCHAQHVEPTFGIMSLRFCRGVYRLIILRASYSNGCVPLTPAVSVDDERVQDYLGYMTGIQFDRLYVKQKEELSLPKYRLLTEEQLKRVSVSP